MKTFDTNKYFLIVVGRNEKEAAITFDYIKRMDINCVNPELTALILQNLGIKPKKIIKIRIVRTNGEQQETDLRVVMNQTGKIKNSETKSDVMIQTAIAVGYANAMKNHELLQEHELKDIVDMFGTIGENKLKDLDDMNRTIIARHFRKKVRA